MVTHTLTETYDNDAHFDLTYIICVWITFLPTVTLPWFYAHWVLIGSLSRSVPNSLVREALEKKVGKIALASFCFVPHLAITNSNKQKCGKFHNLFLPLPLYRGVFVEPQYSAT